MEPQCKWDMAEQLWPHKESACLAAVLGMELLMELEELALEEQFLELVLKTLKIL